MDSIFLYKLGLSFVVGGVWVTLSTMAVERFGSKIGGVIGGLPSTAAVALLFIGITQSPGTASESTTIMPLAQGLNGLFIIAYSSLVRHGIIAGVLGSLVVWFGLASALVFSGMRSFSVSVAGWLLLIVACTLTIERRMTIPSRGKVRVAYSRRQILARAVFGGGVVVFAVLMSKVGGPVYGGVFATFPAMFLSTLVVTCRSGGAEFSRAVAKSMMVSGLFNVAMYAVAVRYLYVWMGLVWGTAAAIFISLWTGYLTYKFVQKRLS
jgi:hypothetical protein